MYSTWYLSVLYFPTPLPTSLTSSPLLASPCSAQQLGSHDHIWIFLAKLDARPTSQKHPGNSQWTPNPPSLFVRFSWAMSGCLKMRPEETTKRQENHSPSQVPWKNMHLGRLRWWKVCLSLAPDWGIHPPFAEMMKKKVDAWSWKPSSNVDYIHIDYRFHQKWTLFAPCSTSLPEADPLLAEALVGEAVIPWYLCKCCWWLPNSCQGCTTLGFMSFMCYLLPLCPFTLMSILFNLQEV